MTEQIIGEKKEEEPREVCGLMLVTEFNMQTKVNLFATKDEVIKAIQEHLAEGRTGFLEFNAADSSGTEATCLFDPRRVIFSMLTRELILKGNVVPISQMPQRGNYGH